MAGILTGAMASMAPADPLLEAELSTSSGQLPLPNNSGEILMRLNPDAIVYSISTAVVYYISQPKRHPHSILTYNELGQPTEWLL